LPPIIGSDNEYWKGFIVGAALAGLFTDKAAPTKMEELKLLSILVPGSYSDSQIRLVHFFRADAGAYRKSL